MKATIAAKRARTAHRKCPTRLNYRRRLHALAMLALARGKQARHARLFSAWAAAVLNDAK